MAEAQKTYAEMRPYEKAIAEIKGQTAEGVDGFEIASQVADKIMSATSLDEAIDAAAQGPDDLENWVGRAFRFIGGTLRYQEASEQYREGGTGYYAVFKCEDLQGDEHTVSTGAVNVVFQLKKFQELGVFDGDQPYMAKTFTVLSRPTQRGTLYRIAYA